MSDLWQTTKNFFLHPKEPLYYGRIPDARAPDVAPPTPVKAGQAYFRLWLNEIYLENDRTWFQEWYPLSHAIVKLTYGNVAVTVPYLVGPGSFKDLDSAHLNQVIQLNRALTGQLPYNGGTVSIQAGLMAMKGNNQLAEVLKVVTDISGLLAVPQLSTVLNIAGPVASGLQGLLSSSSGGLQLGLEQTFTTAGGGANDLRAGYFVAIAAGEAKADANRLWVVNDRLRLGDTAQSSKPYTKASYMLFRLEIAEEHENYEGFVTIQSHVDRAYEHLLRDKPEEAAQEMRMAASETLTSHDLTAADRTRRIRVMKAAYDERKQLAGALNFSEADQIDPEPTMVDRMRSMGSAEQALVSGPLDFGETMRSF